MSKKQSSQVLPEQLPAQAVNEQGVKAKVARSKTLTLLTCVMLFSPFGYLDPLDLSPCLPSLHCLDSTWLTLPLS